MKQYTIGKKAAVIVLHQLCMILMVTGVFATGYAFRHDAHENIDIYTLISLAGLVGSFVSLACVLIHLLDWVWGDKAVIDSV